MSSWNSSGSSPPTMRLFPTVVKMGSRRDTTRSDAEQTQPKMQHRLHFKICPSWTLASLHRPQYPRAFPETLTEASASNEWYFCVTPVYNIANEIFVGWCAKQVKVCWRSYPSLRTALLPFLARHPYFPTPALSQPNLFLYSATTASTQSQLACARIVRSCSTWRRLRMCIVISSGLRNS